MENMKKTREQLEEEIENLNKEIQKKDLIIDSLSKRLSKYG